MRRQLRWLTAAAVVLGFAVYGLVSGMEGVVISAMLLGVAIFTLYDWNRQLRNEHYGERRDIKDPGLWFPNEKAGEKWEDWYPPKEHSGSEEENEHVVGSAH